MKRKLLRARANIIRNLAQTINISVTISSFLPSCLWVHLRLCMIGTVESVVSPTGVHTPTVASARHILKRRRRVQSEAESTYEGARFSSCHSYEGHRHKARRRTEPPCSPFSNQG